MNYFNVNELKCKCGCNEYYFNEKTLKRLNKLREKFGKPIFITSGFRCESYNIQIGATQAHSSGQAVDISVNRKSAYKLLKHAFKLGFSGIGVKQHGGKRYIHLDDIEDDKIRPWIWSYK